VAALGPMCKLLLASAQVDVSADAAQVRQFNSMRPLDSWQQDARLHSDTAYTLLPPHSVEDEVLGHVVCHCTQVVADKCQVHASPCIQIWRDSSLVESVDNPTTSELEDLLQRHGARW
jgi:hypothetical protein